jgi:hypothetical protein
MSQSDLSSPTSSDPLALRREDLAGLVASYQSTARSKKEFAGVFAALGGMAVGPLLMLIGKSAGWSPALDPYFFFLGWALFLTFFGVVIVRGRRIRARYEIHCPACSVSLLGPPSNRGGVTYAELAIATGCCPACGAHILAP